MQMHSGSPIRLATERPDPSAVRSGRPGDSSLEIRVLGEFTVLRNGAAVPLPRSRKTRALLAYLAIDGRRHQRERLCELFWELPDDPRGALRWSLSRIRQVLGAEAASLLRADRSTVQLCLDDVSFGYATIRGLTQVDLNACPLAMLESCAAQFAGPFLADLSVPRCPEFEAWRAAVSDEADVLHIRLLRALIERTEVPERALAYAHQLRRLSPGNPELAREIEELARAARQSAMTAQPAMRTLRVAGARPVAWELMRDRAADLAGENPQMLALRRAGLRSRA